MQGSNSGDGWSYEKFSCAFTSRERGPGQTLQHRVFLFKIKISTGRHFQCILLIRESHKARFQVSGVHIRDGGGGFLQIFCVLSEILGMVFTTGVLEVNSFMLKLHLQGNMTFSL